MLGSSTLVTVSYSYSKCLQLLRATISAFCPYHIGQWTINGLRMMEFAEASKFAGVFTTMVGYVVVAFGLVILHTLLYVVGLNK